MSYKQQYQTLVNKMRLQIAQFIDSQTRESLPDYENSVKLPDYLWDYISTQKNGLMGLQSIDNIVYFIDSNGCQFTIEDYEVVETYLMFIDELCYDENTCKSN